MKTLSVCTLLHSYFNKDSFVKIFFTLYTTTLPLMLWGLFTNKKSQIEKLSQPHVTCVSVFSKESPQTNQSHLFSNITAFLSSDPHFDLMVALGLGHNKQMLKDLMFLPTYL